MNKPTVPDLKELFRQASEIAKQVPESMQQAAFNRALDMLTGSMPPPPNVVPAPSTTNKRRAVTADASKGKVNIVGDLIAAIDSTQHPGIKSANKVLDRALMVLQIALTEHGIDGMMPSDIAQILTEKFRISTKDAAVRMALGNASNLVNRVSAGQGYLYKIMEPGLAYLANSGTSEVTKNHGARPRRKQKIGKAKPQASSEKVALEKSESIPLSKQKRGRAAKGGGTALKPKAAILALVASGYFNQPRTGPQVQAHLKVKDGYNIGTPQLSLAMLRLVRAKELERGQNPEGQYEYRKAP